MIKILQNIYTILSNTIDITDIVEDKIFPDIVPDKDVNGETISYPLIIMKRAGIDPTLTKCNNTNDSATVEILCYSESYFDVVDLAQKVRDKLDFYKGVVDNKKIDYIRMINIIEDFTEGVFYQLLTFQIK